jgi:hypothetical protein
MGLDTPLDTVIAGAQPQGVLEGLVHGLDVLLEFHRCRHQTDMTCT